MYGHVWIVAKSYPTNILVMARTLVFVWMVANIWHANGYLANLVHISCQWWPTHGPPKGQPKFWLAKYLVRQPWDMG